LIIFCILAGTQLVWSQSSVNVSRTDISPENMTSEINELVERLDILIKQSETSPPDQVSDIQTVYLSIIAFMMGLSFVIFGFYIGQEQRLSTFTKRLFLISHLSLMIPITIILLFYLTNKILIGESDPLLFLALLLLIPVVTSYVLMMVKYRRST
jgi:hypothetical protein